MDLRRRQLLACLATAPWAARAQTPSADEEWLDTVRGRRFPVRVRWPATPGPWPLLLFSHGLGGTVEAGTAWAQAWAQAGFAVLHLQHPGSDGPAVRAALSRGLGSVANYDQLVQRAYDVRFALDEVARRRAAGMPGWQDLRTDAIGMSGHSFGAHTTLAVAGQLYPHDLADPRPTAFMAFSPTLPGDPDPRRALSAVTRPMLGLTGSLDGDVVGNGATPERRAAVFDALPAGAKAMLLLKDADHMTFGGQPGRSLPFRRRENATRELEARHTELIARVTTDWWRARLLDDAVARQRLTAPAGLAPGDRWVSG